MSVEGGRAGGGARVCVCGVCAWVRVRACPRARLCSELSKARGRAERPRGCVGECVSRWGPCAWACAEDGRVVVDTECRRKIAQELAVYPLSEPLKHACVYYHHKKKFTPVPAEMDCDSWLAVRRLSQARTYNPHMLEVFE
jgi:hypothetical protein